MADILLLVGFIVLLILIAIIAYLSYCGLFHPVEISTGDPYTKKATVFYKFAQGPYENSGRIFTEVSNLAPEVKCFGLYYDNPDKVSKAILRYAAGAVLSEDGTEPDPELQKKFEAAGFRLFKLPDVSTHVRTAFPFRNMVSLLLAYKRVYPKIMSYIERHKLDLKVMLEIYTKTEIQFMGPQELQDEFFVPEAIKAETDEHRIQG